MVQFVGLILLSFLSIILHGWALHLLWAWLLVPVFEVVSPITIGQAIGLAMISGFLTYRYIEQPKSSKINWESVIGQLIFRPLVGVLFGLIIKQFV